MSQFRLYKSGFFVHWPGRGDFGGWLRLLKGLIATGLIQAQDSQVLPVSAQKTTYRGVSVCPSHLSLL